MRGCAKRKARLHFKWKWTHSQPQWNKMITKTWSSFTHKQIESTGKSRLHSHLSIQSVSAHTMWRRIRLPLVDVCNQPIDMCSPTFHSTHCLYADADTQCVAAFDFRWSTLVTNQTTCVRPLFITHKLSMGICQHTAGFNVEAPGSLCFATVMSCDEIFSIRSFYYFCSTTSNSKLQYCRLAAAAEPTII